MASRNIVTKNNTRCFKSAVVFGLLVLVTSFRAFLYVKMAKFTDYDYIL